MKKVALLLPFLICTGLSSLAQVVFFTTQDTIDSSESTYSAQIKVLNFNEIIGVQFSINWDSTVLEFDQPSDFGVNLSANDNFSTEDGGGALRFFWYDQSVSGVNLSDSTTLFSIRFKVIGQGGSQSNISFSDMPLVREVSDTSFAVINSEFQDGSLLLEGTINSVRNKPEELHLQSISPNPVSNENPRLNFYIKKADTLTFRVVTMNGQEIARFEEQVLAGKQTISLDRSIFPSMGTYLVIAQNADFISTYKLMVQE